MEYLMEKSNLPELKYGDKLILKTNVSWTNSFGNGRIEHSIPAGSVLTIQTRKPEGFECRTETGEFFFLFDSDLRKQFN